MDAPNKALEIKGAITAVIAFGTALFGWVGWLVIVWIFAMFLDYLSGSFAALKNGEWQSSVARQGLWHKLGSIFAVLVAALCDIAVTVVIGQLGAELDYPGFLTPIVCLWYIFTELGSITENVGKLGADIPAWLLKIIHKLRGKVDDAGEDMSNKE